MPVAACQAKEVQNGLYELVDYPAKGFALQLTSVDKWSAVADAVFKLVQYLADNQVAHNVFITRGASLDGQNHGNLISIGTLTLFENREKKPHSSLRAKRATFTF